MITRADDAMMSEPTQSSQSLFENSGLEFHLQAAHGENRLKAELQTEPAASQMTYQTSSHLTPHAPRLTSSQ